MSDEQIAHIRRFSRTVTRRVGVLDEAFLARGRSVAQSRVLWELGRAELDLRALRARLDLDSGYLTRILQGLTADDLVAVRQSEFDGRVRSARLTRSGRREWMELDRRSDAAAAAILEALGSSQRTRLVAAMAEVERLLRASLVRLEPCDPSHPHARESLDAYFAELDERFDGGFDGRLGSPDDPAELVPPAGLVLVATLDGEPVGCGVMRIHRDEGGTIEYAELKRIWISPDVRGLGLGRRMLRELELHGARAGARIARLDTNRVLHEALAMYRSAGYREIPAFTEHPYAHHWFEKALAQD
jgi:DNA-binding MarR family transcriptional regulator